jgi:hypothetical protein
MTTYTSRLGSSIVCAIAVIGLCLPAASIAASTPAAPTVSTSVSSNVSDSAATLYGFVNPNGEETTYAFQYGTSTSYGSQTTLAPAGKGTESMKVTQSISGLTAKTTYHYRIIATNPSGTVQGEDQTFTTASPPAPPKPPAPAAPTVATSSTSGVTYSSAALYGYVDPHGQATNYAFQYGTTSGYGAQTPLAAAGNGTATIKVGDALTGLSPNTLYHYRVIATSSAGKALGADRTFTTGKIPLSLQIVGVPNPVLFGSPFLVEGTLSGTGAANHEIALQVNQFPFTHGFATQGNMELTNSLGGFSFPVIGLTQNAQLRVITIGKPALTSAVLTEQVAVRVTFHARRTHHHDVYRLYGTVTPSEVGALIGFQLLKPGHKSINQGGTAVTAKSARESQFSRRVHIHHPGLYRALIRITDGAHVSSYSAPILIH